MEFSKKFLIGQGAVFIPLISFANRWKKLIDNITPPYKRRAPASRPLKNRVVE